ncbi:hypothetical protein ACEQPO_04895 [Bacillus sp. SL00103]
MTASDRYFCQYAPLRFVSKAELTYQQFLQDVKAHVVDDFGHQDYQYEQMVQDLQLSRVSARNLCLMLYLPCKYESARTEGRRLNL